MKVLVTGGAGFIGSAVIRRLLAQECAVVNVDCLTYAGNLATLANEAGNPRYAFEQADICDALAIRRILAEHQPNAIMHLAAESHVDRSIDGPAAFVETNIVGTYVLLEESRRHWEKLPSRQRDAFRFHHISTDEVYGSLGDEGLFTESTAYDPSSPYSASKAASDHLVRAWQRTYGLPALVTNCSNNYGPYQYPEKLIPLIILNGLEGKPLPVYGSGSNVRDWLYVEDHAAALITVLRHGAIGETYNIGGWNERQNIEVVRAICELLDELTPNSRHAPHARLITHVTDRPGHDHRYAIDASKIERELGWRPQETFETGLRKTVQWYLDHGEWIARVRADRYQGERLGLAAKAA